MSDIKINLEDLPPNVAELANRTATLRDQNKRLQVELIKMGLQGTIDSSDARFEFTMHSLMQYGIITEEQMWSMAVAWETHLREFLKGVKEERVAELNRQRLFVPGRGRSGGRPIRDNPQA